jgi:TPP-dependent pyruvate/acetoin dehydrogenase alpha subunit
MTGSPKVTERFDLRRLYETMVLIRLFEPEAERQHNRANIGGYCHLSTGQEAATVGAVAPLRDEDYLLMSYRTHGLVLARGTPPETVMAEHFGREGVPRAVAGLHAPARRRTQRARQEPRERRTAQRGQDPRRGTRHPRIVRPYGVAQEHRACH